MNLKILVAIIVISVLVIGGGVFALTGGADVDPSTINKATVTGPLTKEEVAKHASENDCWTIISGAVYDITSYIPRHPGGKNILSACGADGTALFSGQMPGQLGGREDHTKDQQTVKLLENYKIGDLIGN